jgi:hypothetical protein
LVVAKLQSLQRHTVRQRESSRCMHHSHITRRMRLLACFVATSFRVTAMRGDTVVQMSGDDEGALGQWYSFSFLTGGRAQSSLHQVSDPFISPPVWGLVCTADEVRNLVNMDGVCSLNLSETGVW